MKPKVKIIKNRLIDNLQSCLRKNGDYVFYRCGAENLHSVIEINLNSLPEHYTEYFFESILKELPESFIVAEFDGKIIGYVMCKIEFGFSNFRELGFVKKRTCSFNCDFRRTSRKEGWYHPNGGSDKWVSIEANGRGLFGGKSQQFCCHKNV